MKPRGIDLNGVTQPPSLVGVKILLDRSGSMSTIKQPMEQAFAQFLDEQRAISEDGMWVTLSQFDSQGYETVYDRKPLAEVEPLVIHPRGGTPLIDSLCRFVTDARAIVDDPSDPTERLLLVVITDGQDTGPNTHTWAQAKELVQGVETADCEMVWMGTSSAILELQEQLPAYAAQAGASLSYANTGAGVSYMQEGMSQAVSAMRADMGAKSAVAAYASSGGDYDITKTEDWGETLEKLREATKRKK